MRRPLCVVSLVACVVFTTCTTAASNKAWVTGNTQRPCATEQKEQEDLEHPCKRGISSVPDSSSKIGEMRHKHSEDGSRKHIIVKKPGHLQDQHKVNDIKDKRIRKITGAQRRDSDVGSPRSGKLKHPHAKHVTHNRGTDTVIHLLRLKALEAIEKLKRKIHNGKLPDLLSVNHTVENQDRRTPTAKENLKASRNKLFRDVRKLIHRMILKNKNAQANPMDSNKQQAKYKVEEYGARQHSRPGSTREKYDDRDEKMPPSNAFEDRDDRRKQRVRDKWGTLARQPLPFPRTDDDGKWANVLDLQQFFHQMNGLPMENRKNDHLFISQGRNNPVDPSGLGGVMMSPPASAAGLTSPSGGAEEFSAAAPKQMLQQQQNQIEGMANYFNTQAQSRAGVQPATLPQPQLMGNPAMQGAAAELSSLLQLNNPLASVQPFLSRFYRPSLPFGAADRRFPERGYFGPEPYSDLDGRGPEATRYDSASIRDPDDDGVESPIPPDAYPEDGVDAEAPDDDDGDDEEDDDAVPYRTQHEKSNIALHLNESKSATRNPR